MIDKHDAAVAVVVADADAVVVVVVIVAAVVVGLRRTTGDRWTPHWAGAGYCGAETVL